MMIVFVNLYVQIDEKRVQFLQSSEFSFAFISIDLLRNSLGVILNRSLNDRCCLIYHSTNKKDTGILFFLCCFPKRSGEPHIGWESLSVCMEPLFGYHDRDCDRGFD